MRMSLFIVALAGAVTLGGCVTDDLTRKITYTADQSFDGAVKAFNTYKSACAKGQLPASCRDVVVKGQDIIRQAYAAEKAGNSDTVQSLIAGVLDLVQSDK